MDESTQLSYKFNMQVDLLFCALVAEVKTIPTIKRIVQTVLHRLPLFLHTLPFNHCVWPSIRNLTSCVFAQVGEVRSLCYMFRGCEINIIRIQLKYLTTKAVHSGCWEESSDQYPFLSFYQVATNDFPIFGLEKENKTKWKYYNAPWYMCRSNGIITFSSNSISVDIK